MTEVLWARIDAAGHLSRGFGATTSIREDGVGYSVTFDRDVSRCGWVVTLESTTSGLGEVPARLVPTVRLLGDETVESRSTLYVVISDLEGAFAHVPFHVAVLCPPRPPIKIPK